MGTDDEAAKERAEEYLRKFLEFDFSSEGGGGPIDPRCRHCEGNAHDVSGQASFAFRMHDESTPKYLAPSVWLSHICVVDDLSERSELPDWITETTTFFEYDNPDHLHSFRDLPKVFQIFFRPCSLCGEKDPFNLFRYMNDGYKQKSPLSDLDYILNSYRPTLNLEPLENSNDKHKSQLEMLKNLTEDKIEE